MRKNIILSVMLTLCVVVLSFACIKSDGVNQTVSQNGNTSVRTISHGSATTDKALEARFLNMLNHNYVYNEAFYDDAFLVNNSMPALLDAAEESYIEQDYLSDYLFNMYGKVYNGFAFLGDNLPQKDGFVYIIPSGYNEYNHTVVSVTDNADGSYTVLTDVVISYLDGTEESLKCETLFLEAEDSAFGFNILYSDIIEVSAPQADC